MQRTPSAAALVMLVGLCAAAPALSRNFSMQYREMAEEELARGDRAGHEFFLAYARGERPAPPELTAAAREAHPVLFRQYEELTEKVRWARAEAAREDDTAYLRQAEHAEADLLLVRYELAQGASASTYLVRKHLRSARYWLCERMLRLRPPSMPPMAVDLRSAQVLVPPSPDAIAMVFFDFDKWAIRADAVDTISLVSDWLRAHPGSTLRVDGHTDWIGGEDYNLHLSDRRAEAAHDFLVEQYGVAPGRLRTRGYGEFRPIAPNATPEGLDDPAGRQMNRRAEFIPEGG